jgi:hypothetical protein
VWELSSASRARAQEDAAERVTQQAVDKVIAGWPATPREATKKMIEKYGLPNEATATHLVWHRNGPWKRTIIYRDELPHNFPKKHVDVMEQFVDYHVPPEKCDDLAAYDGSVTVRRTKGEMSAMCYQEETNFLALNLAHDIVTGKLNAEEARQSYARAVKAFMKGEKHPYMQKLVFRQAGRAGTADPDVEIIKE